MSNGSNQTTTISCSSGCVLSAESTTTTIPTSTMNGSETPNRSISDVYLVFSSYQVTSVSFANTACNTVENVPATLSTPFSVTSQFDNPTKQYYDAQSSLMSSLGLTECTPINDPYYHGPVPVIPFTGASEGLTLRQKNTIAVATSIPIIALGILGVLAWRRARKRKLAAAAITATDVAKQPATTEATQPYLQQKAELEDAERRRHELEADGIVYEMLGEDAIHEVATGDERRRVSTLQELRGAEHSKELEAPTNL